MKDDEMRNKLVAAVHQARGEGFLDENEVPPLLAWLDRAADALYDDPIDKPQGPERTEALRQMLIDTMSDVEQTDDGERMAAALNAFDAKDSELRLPPAPCQHVFSDADGRTRYTFCLRGCGARDTSEPSGPGAIGAGTATDTRPSISDLQRRMRPADLADAVPTLLEIASAALALGPELTYLQGPLSDRLKDALAKVRP